MAPIVRKPAFRKSSWRSRQANQECFSERHVRLVTLTVISSNEQKVKQPTYAVVQVPRPKHAAPAATMIFTLQLMSYRSRPTFDVLVEFL